MTSIGQRPWWKVEGWLLRALLTTFTSVTALFAVRPMVSYRALELDASAAAIGMIAGGYGLFALVMAVPVGRLGDRIGEGPLLIVGTVATTAVAASLLVIDNLWLLGLSQAVIGLSMLTTLVGVQSLVGNAGNPKGRDGRYGGLAAIQSLGQMMGPLGAGWLASGVSAVPPAVWWFSTAASAVGVLFALSLVVRPPAVHERRAARLAERDARRAAANGSLSAAAEVANGTSKRSLREILRTPGLAPTLLLSLAVLTSIDVLAAYLPVYGEANNLPVTVVTSLLALRAAASIISRAVMVPLIRLAGRKRLLLSTAWIPGIAFLAFPWWTNELYMFVLMAIIGFFVGLGQPLTTSWVASCVPPDSRSTALGIRLSGNRIGQMALPAVAGAVAAGTGIVAVFLFIGAILGFSALVSRNAPLD